MVRVKVCGIASVDDALRAVDAGADALGLNFHPPSPRCVDAATAAAIRAHVPPFVHVVGVFVNDPLARVAAVARDLQLDFVQLHGAETPSDAAVLAARVIRAFRLSSPQVLEQLGDWSFASALVLDGAGRPGAFGGATFDWSLVGEARERTDRPLIIAGGLSPQNVAECVLATRPAAVDVASGVETAPGRKSAALMRAFVRAVREASQQMAEEGR